MIPLEVLTEIAKSLEKNDNLMIEKKKEVYRGEK